MRHIVRTRASTNLWLCNREHFDSVHCDFGKFQVGTCRNNEAGTAREDTSILGVGITAGSRPDDRAGCLPCRPIVLRRCHPHHQHILHSSDHYEYYDVAAVPRIRLCLQTVPLCRCHHRYQHLLTDWRVRKLLVFSLSKFNIKHSTPRSFIRTKVASLIDYS